MPVDLETRRHAARRFEIEKRLQEEGTFRLSTRFEYLKYLTIGTIGTSTIVQTTEYVIKYGGGYFIYPFTVAVMFTTLPIYYTEIFIAQYTRKSLFDMYKMAPISIGVFIYMYLISAVQCITRSATAAYAWYFVTLLFSRSELLTECSSYDSDCFEGTLPMNLSSFCVLDVLYIRCPNRTLYPPITKSLPYLLESKSKQYELNLQLVVCLAITWLFSTYILFRTTYQAHKVFNFVSIASALFMTLILILMLSKEGFRDLIHFTYSFQKTEASFYEILFQAIVHSFSIAGLTEPVNHSYSTRVAFTAKPRYDSLIVMALIVVLNLVFCTLNFCALGIISKTYNVRAEISNVPGGDGIMYIVIPHVLTFLPSPRAWLFVYFLCLALFLSVQLNIFLLAFKIGLLNHFEIWRFWKYIVPLFIVVSFLMSLPMASAMGMFQILALYNDSFRPKALALAVFLETFTFYWLYGPSALSDDIQFMKKQPPNLFWVNCWGITPLLTGMIVFYDIIYRKEDLSAYNPFLIGLTSFFHTLFIIVIPAGAIYKTIMYMRQAQTGNLFKPYFHWGPPNPHLRAIRKKYNPFQEIRSQPYTFHQRRVELYREEKAAEENQKDE